MQSEKTLSQNSKYYISRNRMKELEYLCLQYNEWKKKLNEITFLKGTPDVWVYDTNTGDPVGTLVELREIYKSKIRLIEDTAKETDPVLGDYILEAVISDLTYDKLNARRQVPVNRMYFYEVRRKFFYILSQKRG